MTSSYSPVLTTKAVKDDTEQRILRDAHVCHLHTDKLKLYTSTPTYTCTHEHKLLGPLPKEKLLVVVIYEAEFGGPDMSRYEYIDESTLSFREFINQSSLSDYWDIYELFAFRS